MISDSTKNNLLEKVMELERQIEKFKLTETKLLREKTFSDILIDTCPAFYVALSMDYRVLLINKSMLHATGYSQNEVIGRDYTRFFVPKEEHKRIKKVFEKQTTSENPTIHVANHIITKDGRKLLVEWHGRSVIQSSEGFNFFFGVGIDITERNQSELRLKKAYSEIEKLKDYLEKENLILRNKYKNDVINRIIIGKSEAIKKLKSQTELVAKTDATCLVLGETGTGKESVVDMLHYLSPRSEKPLIKVNCSALSETILESELFGHVKGAFSGAIKDKIGRIQAAEGGTLFLDEIGDIKPIIQVKLLRFLDNRAFECVGDSKTRYADVRVVAATNANIKQKVEYGLFRSDLFYRLKIMTFHCTPLRNRKDDIPLLANYFLNQYSTLFKKAINNISEDVMELFQSYQWPGNVRELKHAIEHACVLCSEKTIRLNNLPFEMQNIQSQTPNELSAFSLDPERIKNALHKTSWKKAKAARLLGIHRSTLYRAIDRLKVTEPPKKQEA